MKGRAYLVGGGSGDPGLLTARALELIAKADVILYDRLIPEGALSGARPEAELIYVGKRPGNPAMAQEEISRLIAKKALEGAQVVRLKGGDPFVFGRGGEEALTLREQGVPYEVVPAVTAGVAASAYAGIPVTQRGLASAVALITGHEDPDKPETAIDWSALAAFPGTLVFYMGVGRIGKIAASLIAAGRSPEEPVAVVENGTLPSQRSLHATLATVAERVEEEKIKPPAITVVGAVTELGKQLAWFNTDQNGKRPLAGVTVAVTRARSQASKLAAKLRKLGAHTVESPVIRTVPLEFELPRLELYDLVCFTSPTGVETLLEKMLADGLDARAFTGSKLAVVGPGTAKKLREYGLSADTLPKRFVAEGLVEAVEGLGAKKALVVCAEDSRPILVEGLQEQGTAVDRLPIYRTVAERLRKDQLEALLAADYITFTSGSTVRYLLDAVGGAEQLKGRTRLASIGPITSTELSDRGLEPSLEADSHNIDGLIEAIVTDKTRHS